MRIWIVSDRDYDSDWVVAAYRSEELANEHVALMGGYIEAHDVRSELHPDAVDPVKQRERADEEADFRSSVDVGRRQSAENERAAVAATPRPPHMGLCHCETFSDRPMWTERGYCRYCGGWAPPVFREHMGETALHKEIDKLAIHQRERMREIIQAGATS